MGPRRLEGDHRHLRLGFEIARSGQSQIAGDPGDGEEAASEPAKQSPRGAESVPLPAARCPYSVGTGHARSSGTRHGNRLDLAVVVPMRGVQVSPSLPLALVPNRSPGCHPGRGSALCLEKGRGRPRNKRYGSTIDHPRGNGQRPAPVPAVNRAAIGGDAEPIWSPRCGSRAMSSSGSSRKTTVLWRSTSSFPDSRSRRRRATSRPPRWHH